MIKVNIKKQDTITNFASFITLDKANEWLLQEKNKKSFGEEGDYYVEFEDITAQLNQEKLNAESLAYLAATDYYVIRMMDTGIPIPDGIQVLRQQARNSIVK